MHNYIFYDTDDVLKISIKFNIHTTLLLKLLESMKQTKIRTFIFQSASGINLKSISFFISIIKSLSLEDREYEESLLNKVRITSSYDTNFSCIPFLYLLIAFIYDRYNLL